MSNLRSASPSSDLHRPSSRARKLPQTQSELPRPPHPPRLQHSPSLPNLWSPQSPDQDKSLKEHCKHQSIHPSPQDKPPATMAEPQTRHVKYASISPALSKVSVMKTHTRRRTERDVPHALLTPPLTPSSSIRTTASFESSANVERLTNPESEENSNEETSDPDTESTRILLIENVSRDIDATFVEAEICNMLVRAAETNATHDEIPPAAVARDIVKGINTRLHVEGTFPIVFFDVRLAKIARDILNTKKFDGRLKECDDKTEGGNAGVSARLVTLKELFKLLGPSKFLDGIEGVLSLTVHREAAGDGHTAAESDVKSRVEGDENRMLDFSTVRKVLRTYGSIRILKSVQDQVDHLGVASTVYWLEFHDLRDAETTCNELNGQTVFGLQFRISAGNTTTIVGLEPQQTPQQTPQQPFMCTIANPEGSACEVPTVSLPAKPPGPSEGKSSPTYFYTTMPFDPNNFRAQGPHESMVPRVFPSNGHTFIAPATPVSIEQQQWDVEPNQTIYRSDCISPCYGQDGACQYCPSRSVPNNVIYNTVPFPPYTPPYAFSPQPLNPPIFYPSHFPPPPTMLNVIPTPAHGYEHLDPQVHSQGAPAGWSFDPAIAAVGPGMNTPQPPATLRKHSSARCSATPSMSPSSRDQPAAIIQASESAPVTYHTPSGNDNNQLNIEKIMNGEEVRTTVMIKNIPNKMSDADLTAYINKVCPRRIDFLYLRMDFKNGCNVGYAFVNFIEVQDLLCFARERLGAKWNMFSSEKVLQMSYANYQGKEALVEKFKNSAIMDERESWRPRIFYSSGSEQGLPQPFPPPTHIRRKERSSFNRDTLFPPAVNRVRQSHGLMHARSHQEFQDGVGEHRRGNRGAAYV
ncbi:hypothetical protein BDN70DRAFT_919730 [Pholiota conissans]|uniref:Mei2-like C-terminal RNA recognition motif domain-containing protein n=1 Tax=Pholiota conissans TaxID=109636 RepID=A0A9P6CW73_9AGAR|nr:hypothetical protein BDN70DRAFT_919730 [Pholiota conissans]